MPIKKRHFFADSGAILDGATGPEIDLAAADSLLVHVSLTGADLVLQASPDGGSTWFEYIRWVLATGNHALPVPVAPSLVRLFNDGNGDVATATVEGVRQI